MEYPNCFDVLIIGGGHAGTEAALAAARMGRSTLLLTHNIDTLGQMSCNPAIGGIGKSHLVKEIDALGGIMAQAADYSGIQFRVLNRRKGPAVRATRAQTDRILYRHYVRQALEQQPNLWIFQQPVDDLLVLNRRVQGVITSMGLTFKARTVILCTGTFLKGQIHIGLNQCSGGRAGDPAASALAQRLYELPLRVNRLKTGTPPRIDARTVDWAQMQTQEGDTPLPVMSYLGKISDHPEQRPCFITHTNERTHEIIRQGLDQSPLYCGVIQGEGPRYCPAIEDKIQRFSDKTSHQVFIEPEGLTTTELYPNGISTSLPFATQLDLVHSIKGLENAHITRPGYAIEYDFFDPRDLNHTLESQHIAGLFLAGQINGTTGYEEAGAQGLLAGINAALLSSGQSGWYPTRSEAYLGVLVDDLVTQGTKEPYRMFTSRAEHRLLLREDNADLRLTEIGRKLGLVDDTRWQAFCHKQERIVQEQQRLKSTYILPDSKAGERLKTLKGVQLTREYHMEELLRRPELCYNDIAALSDIAETDPQIIEQIEISIKYAGYIERQEQEVRKLQQHEGTLLPTNFDYQSLEGLSGEVKEKLQAVQPATLGQASRIPGMTPAAVSILWIYIKKHHYRTAV